MASAAAWAWSDGRGRAGADRAPERAGAENAADRRGGPRRRAAGGGDARAGDRTARAEATLAPGIERRDEFTVEGALVTDVGGTIETSVLSTPGMIAMMERCSSVLAYRHLPPGRATVGFEVCVKHVAAALAGTRCQVRSRLTEVVEDRKLRFEVEVTQDDRTIGLGTHERRAIDTSGLANP